MIRKFKNKDIEEVMEIWLETNIKAHKFIDRKYFENYYEQVRNEIQKSEIYVYEKEGKVVGFLGIVEGYIAGIFVKDNMQNNGIGKLLINECKKKYNKLTLNVYEKNEKAVKFYIREGFYVINKKVEDETNEIDLLMEWSQS